MTKRSLIAIAATCLAASLLVPSAASACEACFGAADAAATKGMNNAIFFLLGVIGLVQVGFVKLFWDFHKRSRSLAERREKFRIVQGGLR